MMMIYRKGENVTAAVVKKQATKTPLTVWQAKCVMIAADSSCVMITQNLRCFHRPPTPV